MLVMHSDLCVFVRRVNICKHHLGVGGGAADKNTTQSHKEGHLVTITVLT